jgi:hypothetical protein
MSVTFKAGIIAALAWISIRLVLFYMGIGVDEVSPFVFLNMLGVTAAITVGMFLSKRQQKEESNALLDIKNGLKAGVPYTVLVAVFIYFFYQNINPGFQQRRITEYEAQVDKALANPKEVADIRKQSEGFEVLSIPEMKEQMMSGPKSFYAPGFTMTMTLLALLLWSTLNAIVVAIVYRKVIFKY